MSAQEQTEAVFTTDAIAVEVALLVAFTVRKITEYDGTVRDSVELEADMLLSLLL